MNGVAARRVTLSASGARRMSSHSPRAASSASSPPSYSASEAAQGDQQHQRRDRTKKKKKKSEEELSPEALLRSRARIGLREAYGSAIGDIEAKGIPVRLRQHVNPLRKDFQIPTPAPEWERVYANPLRPLVVDVLGNVWKIGVKKVKIWG